jgi:hypothetical protein
MENRLPAVLSHGTIIYAASALSRYNYGHVELVSQ